jgi:hypothetical protein
MWWCVKWSGAGGLQHLPAPSEPNHDEQFIAIRPPRSTARSGWPASPAVHPAGRAAPVVRPARGGPARRGGWNRGAGHAAPAGRAAGRRRRGCDGDAFDHDGDTDLADASARGIDIFEGDGTTTTIRPAAPTPARSACPATPTPRRGRSPRNYTLCGVVPEDEPDDIREGQELLYLDTRSMAMACVTGTRCARTCWPTAAGWT